MSRVRSSLIIAAAVWTCSTSWLAWPQSALPEYAVKANFLYNFILFTDWPELPGNSIHLCLLGDNPFGVELDGFVGRKTQTHGANLVVRKIVDMQEASSCQVLFFGENERSQFANIRKQLEQHPVLTITDADGLIGNGPMIAMTVINHRVSFEVDARSAKSAGLSFSSKLLQLARRVY